MRLHSLGIPPVSELQREREHQASVPHEITFALPKATPAATGMPRALQIEGEEEILTDVAHHRAAQADRFFDAAEVTFHQSSPGALLRKGCNPVSMT